LDWQAFQALALSPALSLGKQPTSWLELLAFVLALICVICNVRQNPWGWPFAVVSSGLYGWLFMHHLLFGDAAVQVFFMVMSLWAWWQWLFGKLPDGHGLRPRWLAGRQRLYAVVAWLSLWPLLAVGLQRFTTSDVPWLDGALTAGSIVGQVLLGKKFIDNWWVWMMVNLGSVALFWIKGLTLTMVLYAIFLLCAWAGLRQWQKQAW
jgi:nicotinamide mononucleotide transporter